MAEEDTSDKTPEYVHLAKEKQLLAEARKADAEGLQAELQAKKFSIELAREERKRDLELATDEYSHVYRILGGISSDSVKSCIEVLSKWSRLNKNCEITIILQSPGGEIVSGMALFDFLMYLRSKGHRIVTIGQGYAASMAGILLQAGDVRILGKESYLLIHEAQFGAVGSYGEVEDRLEWIKKIHERILNIFAERSNLSKAQIKKKWSRKDWWMDSDDAYKFGFIDEIK